MATNNRPVTAYLPKDIEQYLTEYCHKYNIVRKSKNGEPKPVFGTALVEILRVFFSAEVAPSPLLSGLPTNLVTQEQLQEALSKVLSTLPSNIPEPTEHLFKGVVTREELEETRSSILSEVESKIRQLHELVSKLESQNQPNITMADVSDEIANQLATNTATLERKLGNSLLEETRYQLHNTVNKKIQIALAGLSFPSLADVEKALTTSTTLLQQQVEEKVSKIGDAIVLLEQKLNSTISSDDVRGAIEVDIAPLRADLQQLKQMVEASLAKVETHPTPPTPSELAQYSTSDNNEIDSDLISVGAEKTLPTLLVFPDGLSQAELGRRLGKTSSTVAKSWNKGKIYFLAWTKKFDPDDIAWELRPVAKKGKYYFPSVD